MNSVSSVTLAAFQSFGCSFMYLMMSCCRYITYGFFRTLFSPLRSQYWIVRFSTPRIRERVFLVSMSVFAMNPPIPVRCLLRKTAFSDRFSFLATVASGYVVAPLAGAWIEIGKHRSINHVVAVAPLAGAWIEILSDSSIC